MVKNTRAAWVMIASVVSWIAAPPATAQIVTGRSSAGALRVAAEVDSAGVLIPVRVKSASYDFEFTEPSGDNFLGPRETGRLRIVLTNSGKTPLRSVVARVLPLSAATGLTYNDSITVGDVPVNATRYAIFYFTATESVTSQIMTFQIDIVDKQGSVADSRLFTFLTRER